MLLVNAVSQRRGRGFVDDPQNVQSGDGAGVFGGLPLGIVEVGRYGNDGLRDPLSQLGFGVLPDLLQDHAGDLGRRVRLSRHFHVGVAVIATDHLIRQAFGGVLDDGLVVSAPHQAFDGENGVLRVGNCLALCDLTDVSLAAADVYGYYRWSDAVTFSVFDYDCLASIDNRCHRVGGTEVDAQDLCHC